MFFVIEMSNLYAALLPNLYQFRSLFDCVKNLLHLNVAACLLKLGECRKSIEACNKVCCSTWISSCSTPFNPDLAVAFLWFISDLFIL